VSTNKIVGPKGNIKILIVERFVLLWVIRTTVQLVVPGKSVEASEATFQPSQRPCLEGLTKIKRFVCALECP